KKDHRGITALGNGEVNFDQEGNSDTENRILKEINEFAPDIIFVELGAPKQEKWIARNKDKMRATVFMTVGGALDYYSGEVTAPPDFIANAGLEWLWRLIT